jgi:hypothetical protein
MMKKISVLLMTCFLLACIPLLAYPDTKLDTLLIESGKMKEDGSGGFLLRSGSGQRTILKRVEKTVRDSDAMVPDYPHPLGRGKYVPYMVYLKDIRLYDQKIYNLENQIKTATEVLTNLKDSAKSSKDIVDMLTKIFEAISALGAALGGIYGVLKFLARKKPA